MEVNRGDLEGVAGAMRFEDLYAREFGTVLRYVRTAVGNSDAEDLCSETFIRAFDGWARFRGDDCAARFWVLRIARNAVVDHYRRRGRARLVELADSTEAPTQDHARRLALEAALGHLDRHERDLVALRAAGLSYTEIAALDGRAEAAIRKAHQRALDRVRPHLEGVM